MVSTKSRQEEEEELEKRRRQERDLDVYYNPSYGNAALSPTDEIESVLREAAKKNSPDSVFSRQDPEEKLQAQAERCAREMRELHILLHERFEELFRLLEQLNFDRENAKNAFLNIQDGAKHRNPDLGKLIELSRVIESDLSRGLVSVIPELPQMHGIDNVIEFPVARANIGSEEIGGGSSISIEISNHESLGAAMQERSNREEDFTSRLLGMLSDLSTTVGFAIQSLVLADEPEAIHLREELIRHQGVLKVKASDCETAINQQDATLLMLFDAMETRKKDTAA